MRRTPVTERPDDFADDSPDRPTSVRRISTAPGEGRAGGRGESRYRRGSQWRQGPPRRGPSARAWTLRALLGLCTLAAIWFVLQWLFPIADQRSVEPRARAETPVPSEIGAPEPPATAAVSQPAPTLVPPPTVAVVGDRLPGLSTPGAATTTQPPQAAAPSAAHARSTPEQVATSQEQAQAGSATVAPIPPPEGTPGSGAVAQSAPPPLPTLPPPPPPAPAGTNGSLQLRALATPANPVSENATVTISLNLTSNGNPVAGGYCMATVYFRTATVRQPMGGVTTGPGGVASFTIDAKGATFDRYVPVDVTCTTRQGNVSARTGFTPVRGR